MSNGKPVYVIADNSIDFTGAFKAALSQAELLENDFEFIWIIPSGAKQKSLLTEKGFTVYELPFKEIKKSPAVLALYLPYLLSNSMAIKKIVKQHSAVYLQVNDFYNLTGCVAKMLGAKAKLVTYVRFLPNAITAPLRKLWTALAQRFSDHVIAVSDAVLQQMPSAKNTVRIYDAVYFKEQHHDINGPLDGITRFLYLANYIRGKGQEHALASFEKALIANKHIHLHFAGGDMGLQKNRDFKKELQQAVQEKGLGSSISFGDFAADIEVLIKQHDVVLNFSEAESFSMTCAEAGFYGKPVIASKCGGPEEIIDDGKTGLLVQNKNRQQMEKAILQLAAALPGDRRMMGAAAKKYVTEKFSTEQFINSFLTVIHG